MMTTAYAKSVGGKPARVQLLVGCLVLLGEPLQGRRHGFHPEDVVQAGRLQPEWMNR